MSCFISFERYQSSWEEHGTNEHYMNIVKGWIRTPKTTRPRDYKSTVLMALCLILIYRILYMHSTHGHNGAFSSFLSIKFDVNQSKNWMVMRFAYTDTTRSIEKSYNTVAWSCYSVILHGAIWLWRHCVNGPQTFSDHLLDVAYNHWIRVQSLIKLWWL